MKKILVPTDFSEMSAPSFRYALMLAEKMQTEVVLLHVINISNSEMMLKRARLEEEIISLSRDDAARMIHDVSAEASSNVRIEYEYRLGHPVHKVIEHFVGQHNIGMIVMGLHGEGGGLRKVLMGSTTSAVINNSSVPVLAVPTDANFHLEKIFYATDMTNLIGELRILADFARHFNASIHIVHVSSGEVSIGKAEIREKIGQVDYPNIYFHVLRGEEVASLLDTFVRRSKAHLLATFTHKLDFFEKLFSKSVTHELAAQNHLPLLTYNRERR